MAGRYAQYDVQIFIHKQHLTDIQKVLVDKFIKQQLVEMTVKLALLGNPEAVKVSACYVDGTGSYTLDLTPDEGTFALKS